MMTKEQLNERIEKKNKDITKINKRIEKWSKTCSDEDIAIAKELGMTDYKSPLRVTLRKKYNEYKKQYDINTLFFNDIDEVMYAYSDLRDAQNTLEKYQVQLTEIVNFEKEDKIEILVEFLNKWRAQTYTWYIRNAELYIELKDKQKEAYEQFKIENDISVKNISENYRIERRFLESYYSMINNITKQLVYRKTIDTEKLNKILDDEVTKKYKDLVRRITKVVGEIQDVSNLGIGSKQGEINGTVKGTKGIATVNTISAGGYNQNQIVNVKHGQIFHYRVLVHKINN